MTSLSPRVKKPINVLHVVPKLTTSGGIGNQLLTLLRGYDKGEFSPVVCSLREKGEVGREIESIGIEVISLGWDFRKGFYPGLVKKLYEIMKEKEIQVVRSHEYRAHLHGCPAAWLAGVPCIIASVHNIYMPRDKRLNRRLTNRFLSSLTDRVVTVSEAVKKDVLEYDGIPEDKLTVIYNGVDEGRFTGVSGTSVRREFNIPDNATVVGTVGRLFPQKGHRFLIEAVSLLKDEYPLVRLLFVGEGPLLEEMKRYAGTEGIDDRVVFTGVRRDIPELLSAMDIFVFPSLWEGFGNALIEAMAAGKPVIAADIPAVREIIRGTDSGIIVPPERSQAIAEALRRLLRDRPLAAKLGVSARQRVLSMFTIDKAAQNYQKIFRGILTEKGLS